MASQTPEIRSKVQEGIRALRAGRIGSALEAWDAALSMEPDCADAIAFRDYVKQNRIRMAVHIGRQPPAEGAPLELPQSWPPAPSGLCAPPDSQLSPLGESATEEVAGLEARDSEAQGADYHKLEIEHSGSDLGDSPAPDGEAEEFSPLEILLDEEPSEAPSGEPESPDFPRASSSGRESTAEPRPRYAKASGAPERATDSAFAEDAPTLTRDPEGPAGRAPTGQPPTSDPGARPASEARSPALDVPQELPQGASPRGTLMGVGMDNPFAGGLKASFGPGRPTGAPGAGFAGGPGAHLKPAAPVGTPRLESDQGELSPPLRRAGPGSEDPLDFDGAEGSFSEDLPTRVRKQTPHGDLHDESEALSLDTYSPGEDSFSDDLPTRALSSEPRASGSTRPTSASLMRSMPPQPEAQVEEAFSEDQITIARPAEPSRGREHSVEEESDSLDDPRRGLSMARLLYDEGAFERSLQVLEQLGDRYGDLPGSAELMSQCQDALESLMVDQIGPTDALASPRAPSQKLSDLDLDPRAAYLFSRIDGTLSIEDLLDISGMSRFETLRNLLRLRELGLLEFERGR